MAAGGEHHAAELAGPRTPRHRLEHHLDASGARRRIYRRMDAHDPAGMQRRPQGVDAHLGRRTDRQIRHHQLGDVDIGHELRRVDHREQMRVLRRHIARLDQAA